MNLLPLARRVAAASIALSLEPVKPIGNFKIIYPKLSARSEAVFVMSDIKLLVEKINNKHCQ